MMSYLRYALATFCFAASVGCLLLWPQRISSVYELQIRVSAFIPARVIAIVLHGGYLTLGIHHDRTGVAGPTIRFVSDTVHPEYVDALSALASNGRYNEYGHLMYFFPLWYPALIFALAGVVVLRFRRQFSIRSALICVSVIAALLGMAVVL
jgi:hypothetical protein